MIQENESVTCTCGKVAVYPISLAGKKGKCPRCGHVMLLPGVALPTPAPLVSTRFLVGWIVAGSVLLFVMIAVGIFNAFRSESTVSAKPETPVVHRIAHNDLPEPVTEVVGLVPVEQFENPRVGPPPVTPDPVEPEEPIVLRGSDWLEMTEDEKLDYCSSAFDEDGGVISFKAIELCAYLIEGIKQGSKAETMELSTLVEAARGLIQQSPLAAFSAEHETQTSSFIVSERTFVPVIWTCDSGSLTARLLNHSDGEYVESLIFDLEPPIEGGKYMWIDPGVYYLDVDCEKPWKIVLYRDKSQLPENLVFD